jgi:hypothetical protein
MAYSRDAYSKAPYSGPQMPDSPPGQVIPPPIPGATTRFTWSPQVPVRPWSYGGWSGASSPIVYEGGGIVVAPVEERGVVTITAWWPDAAGLQIARVTPDGVRTKVRGAYPLVTMSATRTNLCPNPSAEAGLNGYVPGTGVPTLSSITRPDLPAGSNSAWRATIASAGTDEVIVPGTVMAGQIITIGADLRLSAPPTGMFLTINWVDAAGSPVTTPDVTLSANTINQMVAQFGRATIHPTPPTGAVRSSTISIRATGLPAGATMDGSRITLEQGITDGAPFDGDSLGGQWTGVTQLSTSVLAPLMVADDGECPLDVPVVYVAYDPALLGGSVSTPPVTLPGNDRSWLTHPAQPTAPVRCYPTTTPTPVRTMPRMVLPIIDRPRPVVVTGASRQAPTGNLRLWAGTFADRDELLDLVQDGSPLLLRASGDYGYGYGQWLSLADLTEDADGRPAPMEGRFLSADYTEVDAPASVALVGV